MSRLRTPTPPPRPVCCLGYKSQCLVLAVMCHTNKIFMMHQDNSPSGFLFCCAGTSRCQAGYSYGVLQQTFTRCYGLHYRCLFRHPVQLTRYILFWPVSGQARPPCIFGSVFTMAHWALVRPQHTEWTWDWASYRTRTRGGDQWSSGGQNITTNSGQCGEIIMIRFICALSSVLWAPCPISPHYEGHYHAAPATICSLSDWNYLYKVRLATENNNLEVD